MVVRAPSSERVVDIAEALLAGGVDVIEVTFTIPRAHYVLEQVVDKLAGKMLVGAGTVLDTETARTAILAGAQFIVSPTLNLDVIRLMPRHHLIAGDALKDHMHDRPLRRRQGWNRRRQ